MTQELSAPINFKPLVTCDGVIHVLTIFLVWYWCITDKSPSQLEDHPSFYERSLPCQILCGILIPGI